MLLALLEHATEASVFFIDWILSLHAHVFLDSVNQILK